MVAGCFDPRHAIRVEADGGMHDFVICFECLQVYWYVDGERKDSSLASDSPEPLFDRVLREAGVTLAPKDK